MIQLRSTLPLHWAAGYEYLLVAMARLCDAGNEVTLSLPPVGPDRERVLFTIHDLDLVDRVRWDSSHIAGAIELFTPVDWTEAVAERPEKPPNIVTDLPAVLSLHGSRPDRVVAPRSASHLWDAIVELSGAKP